MWIKDKIQNSKDDASAACNDYLKALGFVSIAHAWIKVLEVSFKDYDKTKIFMKTRFKLQIFILKEFYQELKVTLKLLHQEVTI